MSFIFFTHAIIFLFFLPRMAILYGLRFFWRRQVAFISLFSPWEGKENAVMVGIFFSFVSQRNGQEWGGKGAREAPDSSASRIQHGAARQLGAWQSLLQNETPSFVLLTSRRERIYFFSSTKKIIQNKTSFMAPSQILYSRLFPLPSRSHWVRKIPFSLYPLSFAPHHKLSWPFFSFLTDIPLLLQTTR